MIRAGLSCLTFGVGILIASCVMGYLLRLDHSVVNYVSRFFVSVVVGTLIVMLGVTISDKIGGDNNV